MIGGLLIGTQNSVHSVIDTFDAFYDVSLELPLNGSNLLGVFINIVYREVAFGGGRSERELEYNPVEPRFLSRSPPSL